MGNEAEKVKTDRRGFLKITGLASAAGTSVLATGGQAEADEDRAENGLGYQETDHVKAFYKSARF